MKTILALALGALIGASIAVAIEYFGPWSGCVVVAVISACVVVWYAVKAVRTDREKMRRGRDAVWQRRIEAGLRPSQMPTVDQFAYDDWLINDGDANSRWRQDELSSYRTYRNKPRRPIETIKPEERHGL